MLNVAVVNLTKGFILVNPCVVCVGEGDPAGGGGSV